MVVQHVESTFAEENIAMSYVYFDYKDTDRQSVKAILRNLPKQLLEQLKALLDETSKLRDGKKSDGNINLNADECVALLGRTTESFDRVFLLFDAHDECLEFDVNNNEWRSKMVLSIDKIRERMHVFITSRSHVQLSLELHDCTSLKIWVKDTTSAHMSQRG